MCPKYARALCGATWLGSRYSQRLRRSLAPRAGVMVYTGPIIANMLRGRHIRPSIND
jgi:hypothetical protein